MEAASGLRPVRLRGADHGRDGPRDGGPGLPGQRGAADGAGGRLRRPPARPAPSVALQRPGRGGAGLLPGRRPDPLGGGPAHPGGPRPVRVDDRPGAAAVPARLPRLLAGRAHRRGAAPFPERHPGGQHPGGCGGRARAGEPGEPPSAGRGLLSGPAAAQLGQRLPPHLAAGLLQRRRGLRPAQLPARLLAPGRSPARLIALVAAGGDGRQRARHAGLGHLRPGAGPALRPGGRAAGRPPDPMAGVRGRGPGGPDRAGAALAGDRRPPAEPARGGQPRSARDHGHADRLLAELLRPGAAPPRALVRHRHRHAQRGAEAARRLRRQQLPVGDVPGRDPRSGHLPPAHGRGGQGRLGLAPEPQPGSPGARRHLPGDGGLRPAARRHLRVPDLHRRQPGVLDAGRRPERAGPGRAAGAGLRRATSSIPAAPVEPPPAAGGAGARPRPAALLVRGAAGLRPGQALRFPLPGGGGSPARPGRVRAPELRAGRRHRALGAAHHRSSGPLALPRPSRGGPGATEPVLHQLAGDGGHRPRLQRGHHHGRGPTARPGRLARGRSARQPARSGRARDLP